jgi:pyruvate,water dikinase
VLQTNPDTVVIGLSALCKTDVETAGGKGANLGELIRIGVPVPPGFVVTSPAYFRFLEEAGIRKQAESLIAEMDVDDMASVDGISARLRGLIENARLPDAIAAEIMAAYETLGGGPVAVRSSATAEDLAHASFAGQQETYLNIEGTEEVLRAVQMCWASLFEPRAILYREKNSFGHMQVGIAAVVQQMVQSERSGVMFTVHPVTHDSGQVVIEAVYGLGEAIVSGMVTPDTYVLDKDSGAVLDAQVTPQEQELVRAPEPAGGVHNHWVEVDWGRRSRQKLSEGELAELADIGVRLEEHFGGPQDIEWASRADAFYILQSRAVTTTG